MGPMSKKLEGRYLFWHETSSFQNLLAEVEAVSIQEMFGTVIEVCTPDPLGMQGYWIDMSRAGPYKGHRWLVEANFLAKLKSRGFSFYDRKMAEPRWDVPNYSEING